MLIQFEDVKNILDAQDLDELDASIPVISTTKDSPNKINKILRPQGIVVQDTWNNFIFPIRPIPRIDTARFDTIEVIKRFRTTYSTFPSLFLPWHFVVELIGDRYYVLQMRPIDTKFPMSNEEVLNAQHYFNNDVIKDFFEKQLFQVNEMIHVCLVGDSTSDIYSEKIYRLISRICVAPYFRNMFIPGNFEDRIFNFGLGDKFNFSNLVSFAKK